MDTLELVLNDGLYQYDFEATNNKLLSKIADLLTTEIQESDFYKKLLNNKPYEYRGDSETITRADNYIVLGCLYEPTKYLLTNESFTNLMEQWRLAYNNLPQEMFISIDHNKNFTINYKKPCEDIVIKSPQKSTSEQILNESLEKSCFIEVDQSTNELLVFPTNNDRLNLFAYLLTSDLPYSNFLEILNQPPYEYDDGVYYMAKIENRLLINDITLEVNVLPPLDKFLDLIEHWKLVIAKKPHHIYISIDDDYNFKIVLSNNDGTNVF